VPTAKINSVGPTEFSAKKQHSLRKQPKLKIIKLETSVALIEYGKSGWQLLSQAMLLYIWSKILFIVL
jgi:hypothetical protein